MIVIGGGLVGSAIAYGLQRKGVQTLMLDEGDIAFRAARGNFGLIWVQSKGIHFPPYARWTWQSAQMWAELDAELRDVTSAKLDYLRPGGVEICLNPEDLNDLAAELKTLHTHAPHVKYDMLDRHELAKLLPGLGQNIAGGSYSTADGHVNPLALLRALHQGFIAKGGQIISGETVAEINHHADSFAITTQAARHSAARLVIAAGLGTQKLAAMVDLHVPVRPVRGQNLITERLQPFLRYPTGIIRQTAEGTVQIGASSEEVGMDESTSPTILASLAADAVRVFPHLQHARIVRSWGALRTMTPDGYPIYMQSITCPGASAAVCHSGVTLAAAHVLTLAPAIADGTLPQDTAAMTSERFADV